MSGNRSLETVHKRKYGYGIVDKDGAPWWDAACVCQDREPLADTVKHMNGMSGNGYGNPPYRVVRLFWQSSARRSSKGGTQRKIVKNQLMLVAEAAGHKSHAKMEIHTYTNPIYIALVAELVKAIEQETDLEYACKLVELEFEGWRSHGANLRAARA